jgi:DNA-directed RNA polymerase specialized sigma24 family protein
MSATLNPKTPTDAADVLQTALSIAERRKRLQRQSDELVQETYAVVLQLTDAKPEGFGLPYTQVAQLLGVSKQRLSQLVEQARKARTTPDQR